MRTFGWLLVMLGTGCSLTSPGQSDTYTLSTANHSPPTTAPPPPELSLSLTDMVPGEEASLMVSGAPAGTNVHIGRSLTGLDESVCPPSLEGACLGLARPIRRHAVVVADDSGTVSDAFVVPDRLGSTACFQAVTLPPTLAMSATVCGTVSDPPSTAEELPGTPFFGWVADPQPDGTFDLTWDLWWGYPGDEARLKEDGVVLAEQDVAPPDSIPGSQSGRFALTDRPPGEHVYIVSLCNDAGCTESSPLTLTVLSDTTTEPGTTDPGTTTAPGTGDGDWEPDTTGEGPEHDRRVIGYFTEWGIYGRDYLVADIPAHQLTHIHYAFGMIMGDDYGLVGSPYRCLPPPSAVPGSYELAVCDPWATLEISSFARSIGPLPTWEDASAGRAGNLQQLRNLKALYPHLQTLLSVGGWSLSGDFSVMAADPELRSAFIASAIEFVNRHGFDGIDLDWEYPVVGGESDSPGVPEDAANFLTLLQELRAALGPERPLAVALGAGPAALEALDLVAIAEELTYLTLMTYDFHGAWEVGTPTAHQAGLYDHDDPIDEDFNMASAVETVLAAGVPADKVVPGLPFYGRSFSGVAGGDSGFGAPFTGAGPGSFESGILDYKDIVENFTAARGYTRHWDDTAKAPWLYSPDEGIYISYDDPCSIGHKVAYANTYDLGGLMFWETSGDDGALLDVVDRFLTIPTSTPCGAEG